MKLCWLVPNDHGGGVISVAVSCCRQAAEAGHEVTLLMMSDSTGWIDEFKAFPVAELGSPPREIRGRRAVEWLDDHPQDALFINNCSAFDPVIPYLPEEIRVFYVVHDTASEYWKRAVRHESCLDAIIAVSRIIASQFKSRLDKPEKLFMLHNGTVYPSESEVPDSPRHNDLVFLGGSKSIKGADDVLKLWAVLVRGGFEGRLHWFGGLDNHLKTQVGMLPASDRVQLYGRVPRSKIFDQASQSKVLLMLSRVEPFGMATIECMGMGCVPVAWDIDTGTREIVQHGKTGYFAPLGHFDRLAEVVLRACTNHDSLGPQAQRHTRMHFSESAMWRRYEKCINEVMSRPPASRPEAGKTPPKYQEPTRFFQLLPSGIRQKIREIVARSPRLGHWLRDLRGI